MALLSKYPVGEFFSSPRHSGRELLVVHSLDPIQAFLEKKLSKLGRDLKRFHGELAAIKQMIAVMEETSEFKATKRRGDFRIIGGGNDRRSVSLEVPNSACARKENEDE